MDDNTVPQRCRRSATLIALLLVVSSLGVSAASAQENPGDLGEVLWPKEEHRGFEDLAGLGASLFNDTTEPLTVGLTPVESLQAERIDATTSRLTAHEEGGRNVSFVQRHSSWDGASTTGLTVRPSQFLPMVGIQMETNPYARDVFTLTGPPGSIELNGTTAEEKAKAFAEGIGFPVQGTNTDLDPRGFPGLFSRQKGCYETSNGACTVSASFEPNCPSCTLVGLSGPSGNSSRDRWLAGNGWALFDDQDRLIAATVTYAFDLNESAVLDLPEARDQAADGLRDRGYELLVVPDPEDVRVMGVLAPGRVDVREVHYRWDRFGVPPDSSSPVRRAAYVVQNAATGEVLSVDFQPATIAEPPRPRFPIPTAGLGLVLIGLGIVAAARRRPGKR